MERQLPGSLVMTLRLLLGVVLLSVLTTVLTWLRSDQLLLSWARGSSQAQEILAQGGLEALRADPIVPSFLPLAIVSLVVFASLAMVLGVFLVHGHRWARPSLTTAVLFTSLVAVISLGRHLPPLFVGLSVAALVLHLALLCCLWHKDTTAYLRRV